MYNNRINKEAADAESHCSPSNKEICWKIASRPVSRRRATQIANMLFADLKMAASSESALLGDAALDLLETVSQTENTYCSRKGGQWGNVADNGIQIKHLPTGIAVSCDESRFAHANRALAMKRLRQILASLPCDSDTFSG